MMSIAFGVQSLLRRELTGPGHGPTLSDVAG